MFRGRVAGPRGQCAGRLHRRLLLPCSLTPATRGLLDAQAIAAVLPRVQLVNVARGEIVDEDALVAALQQGRLAGAFLAVFAQEPLRNPAID